MDIKSYISKTLRLYESSEAIEVQLDYKNGNIERHSFENKTIKVGRSKRNDLVVSDIFVSRSHCILKYDGEQSIEILPAKGQKKVLVNDIKMDALTIKSGESVWLGDTRLTITLPNPEATASPEDTNFSELSTEHKIESPKSLATSQQSQAELEALGDLDAVEHSSPKLESPASKPMPSRSEKKPKPGKKPKAALREAKNETSALKWEEENVSSKKVFEDPWQTFDADNDDYDEDDEEDTLPGFYLKDLLQQYPGKRRSGEAAVEIIRYRGTRVFDITVLREGQTYARGDKETPRFKFDKNKQLKIANYKGDFFDVQTGNELSAPQGRAFNLSKWTPCKFNQFELLDRDIYYRIRRIQLPPITLPEDSLEIPARIYYFSYSSLIFHLCCIFLFAFLTSEPENPKLDESKQPDRFVEVQLKTPEPPKPKATPAPTPKPIKLKKAVAPSKTKVVRKTQRRSKVAVSKQVKNASKEKPIDISQVGALGKIGGSGLFAKTKSNSQQLLAASSNITAVKSKGGIQTFSVTGNISGMPGKEIRMAQIAPVGKVGGNPQGDGFGKASVGARTQRKIKGAVVNITPPQGEVGVRGGGLTQAEIAAVVQQHLSEIRYCYEKGLLDDPALSGKIVAKWTISPTGSVNQSGIKSSSVRNSGVHRCLTQQIRSWKFPNPRNQASVLVTFPFVFNSSQF